MLIVRLRRPLVSLAVAACLITAAPAVPGAPVAAAPAWAQERPSCNANDNLDEIADEFISRCRRASIREQFPSEYLPYNIGAIFKDARKGIAPARTARKLLTDNDYARPR